LKRRQLIKFFIVSSISEEHHNKILGLSWTLLDPLIMMFVYILFVTVIFRRGTPRYPVLLFTALLSWKWFTASLSTSVTSVTANSRLIKSVKFPLSVFPLSNIIAGFIDYLFGLVILIPLLFLFEAKINMQVAWFPVLVMIQAVFITGLCLLLSCLGVYFRDIRNLLQYMLRICFFLSPILYSVADRIPERYHPLYMLNPFAALFVSYKNVLVRGEVPTIYILYTLLVAVSVFFIGFFVFIVFENRFAKEV